MFQIRQFRQANPPSAREMRHGVVTPCARRRRSCQAACRRGLSNCDWPAGPL